MLPFCLTYKSIVITKADKGSAIVITGRDDYIEEAERQLSDDREEITEKVHQHLNPNPTEIRTVGSISHQKSRNPK